MNRTYPPDSFERHFRLAGAILVALAIAFAGCRDPIGTDEGATVATFAYFSDGFQSDSFVISLDEVVVVRTVTGDERLGTSTESLLTSVFGRHNLAIALPLQQVRAETTLVNFSGYTTFVTVRFDRAKKALTWIIEYGMLD